MTAQHLHDELVELTKELIGIPSVHSRPAEIVRCADRIGDWLAAHDIPFRRFDRDGIPSLAVLPAAESCPVLFMSHFDVVEAEERQFSPYVDGGRLFGRGAIDDKYAVALLLVLCRQWRGALMQAGHAPDKLPFGLLFTGDEEIGGARGAGYAATVISADYLVALDGGRPNLIITKEKGIMSLTLTARGKAAHAARPWLGENAFDILTEDYLRLKKLFAAETADHWHPTLVLSNCRAGNGSTNAVPATATATLDIRYTENDDPDRLLQLIRESVRSEIAVRTVDPVFQGGDSPYTELLARLTGAATGFEHGASDIRHFSQHGVPGAVWGADGEMSQHGSEEHVTIESLAFVYDSLSAFFGELLRERGIGI